MLDNSRRLVTMIRRTTILAAAALLTLSACSSEEGTSSTATPTPAADQTTEPVSYECTDPLAGSPSEVDAFDLIVCSTLALAATDGYVTTSTVEGSGTTVLRVNGDPFTVEVSYPDDTAIIANETDAWVDNGSGEWQRADVTSNDYLIAQASQVFDTYKNSQDPAKSTADIPEGTTYTVEGTEEIDGVEYHILSAEFNDGSSTSTLRMWIGPDYRQQRMLVSIVSEDTNPLLVETEYVEWDVAQDITLPE